MARIGFVASYSDEGRSGIGQWEINVSKRLPALGGEHEFVVFAREDAKESFVADGLKIATYPAKYKKPLPNLLWHHTGLHKMAKREGIDLMHLTTQQRLVWRKPCRVTGTIHDLGTYHIENKYGRMRDFYLKRCGPRFARRMDALMAISEFTKKDLINFWGISPEKILVIHDGIGGEYFEPRDPAQCKKILSEKFSLPDKFLLYIARLDHPSKNHINLLKGFKTFKGKSGTEHGLVLAGSKWYGSEVIFRTVEELGLKDDVVFTGFVPNEDVPHLLTAADVFVFPSLFEGFGIPPLEAMACGTPVACSNVAAIPEIVGDAALTYNPEEPEQIADALLKITTDESLRRDLTGKGKERASHFTWENTARETIKFFDNVLAGHFDG